MRIEARTALPLAALLLAFAGCTALFGLGELSGGEADGGGVADGALDGRPTGSADGGCTCLSDVPAGWTMIGLGEGADASCPAGYRHGTDIVVDPSLAPATCTCTCSVSTPPSCVKGSAWYTAGCGDAGGYAIDTADGGCTARGFAALSTSHTIDPVPPSGGACTAAVSTKLPEAGVSGILCAVGGSDPATAACETDAGLCAPSVVSPFALCIAHQGSVPCPPGYVISHTAGTSLADTRACGPCSCGGVDAGCTATFSWFADPACANPVASIPANGACQPNLQADAAAYRYTATVQAACDPPAAQPQPTGSASLTSPLTICCP